jgi:hypothetical protein
MAAQDERAAKAITRRCCGRLAAVIALRCAAGDYMIRTLRQRFGNEKFKFACLIAPGCQPCLVIALDVQFRPAQVFAEAGQRLHGRGQMGEMHAFWVIWFHIRRTGVYKSVRRASSLIIAVSNAGVSYPLLTVVGTAFPFGCNHLSGQKSVQKRSEKSEVFFLSAYVFLL